MGENKNAFEIPLINMWPMKKASVTVRAVCRWYHLISKDPVDSIQKAEEIFPGPAHEDHYQPIVQEILAAAAGNQKRLKFEIEDKGQPEPREDIQCFIEKNKQWIKGGSVEIKKKFSKRLLGNKRAGGLLFSYGVRDCPSGTYYSCLTTLQHWFFFKTSNKRNKVKSFAIAPPFGSPESELFTLEKHNR